MFVEENSASIYLQGMRDRSMRSGTKFAREIQLTDWSTTGNLSNRSSGVQIPRDICTHFGRYLYSTRCSWIIKLLIQHLFTDQNYEIQQPCFLRLEMQTFRILGPRSVHPENFDYFCNIFNKDGHVTVYHLQQL